MIAWVIFYLISVTWFKSVENLTIPTPSIASSSENRTIYYIPPQDGLIANVVRLQNIWNTAYLNMGIRIVALAFESPPHQLNSSTISLCEIFSLPVGIDCCASETCLLQANCSSNRTIIFSGGLLTDGRSDYSCKPADFRLHRDTKCIREAQLTFKDVPDGGCIAGSIPIPYHNNQPHYISGSNSRMGSTIRRVAFREHYNTLFSKLLIILNFSTDDESFKYSVLTWDRLQKCHTDVANHNHHTNRIKMHCLNFTSEATSRNHTAFPDDSTRKPSFKHHPDRIYVHLSYRNITISEWLQRQGFKTYLDIKSSFYSQGILLSDLDVSVLEIMLICYAHEDHIHGNLDQEWMKYSFYHRCNRIHVFNSTKATPVPAANANSSVLYYITTDEGLISHVAQLETILDKFRGRRIVLLPFTSIVHYPGSRSFTLCDVFVLPDYVTCCQGDSCLARVLADYNCVINGDAAGWALDPGLYNLHPDTPIIDFSVANQTIKDSVHCIAGFFMSGMRVQFQVVFKAHVIQLMGSVLEQLQLGDIDEYDVFHWRRGDQLSTRCKPSSFKDQSANCESATKLIKYINSFVNSSDLHSRITDLSRVYIATNEQNATSMALLRAQGFHSGVDVAHFFGRQGIVLGSLDLFVLELALMCNARKSHLLGRSGIKSFITRCRLQRLADIANQLLGEE